MKLFVWSLHINIYMTPAHIYIYMKSAHKPNSSYIFKAKIRVNLYGCCIALVPFSFEPLPCTSLSACASGPRDEREVWTAVTLLGCFSVIIFVEIFTKDSQRRRSQPAFIIVMIMKLVSVGTKDYIRMYSALNGPLIQSGYWFIIDNFPSLTAFTNSNLKHFWCISMRCVSIHPGASRHFYPRPPNFKLHDGDDA
jgi:hypothetical protein